MIRIFSLRAQLLVAEIIMLLMIGAVMIVYIHTSLQENLSLQIQKRGVAVAHSLARMAVNPSLTENFIELQLMAYDFRNAEEDIEYVFIADKHGRLSAHTFREGFPDLLAGVNPLSSGDPQRIRTIRTEQGVIYDISVPILKGELGTAHVGLKADSIQRSVRQITWQSTWLLLGFLLLACCVAFILASSLTRSIKVLIQGVDAVSRGDLTQRIPAKENDEIGHLAAAFNQMTVNLQSTTVSRNELEKLNIRLEGLVEERTRQLSSANAELTRKITERRKAEEEVRQLNASLEKRIRERTMQLEATNHELEAFGYSVSHDLYAPLRHIEGFSRILLEDNRDRLDRQGVHCLERITAGVKKMKELIDALLNLSRVGRIEMRQQEVDLSSLARGIFQQLRETYPERAVTVSVEDGLKGSGDKTLLGIALQNLLENAWKYTSRQEQASIAFGRTVSNGEPEFFVRDNGIGFDMTYADSLFGVFRRLVSNSEFPGTGIGLATVQRIIARHGGRVRAEGEPGQGATFYFTLCKLALP